MSDFKKLKAPQQGSHWYVATDPDDVNDVEWLTIHGTITSCTTPMDDLYYDTELEALEASFKYYHKHGHVYPYAKGTIVIGTMEDDIDGSQIMEFI